MVKTETRIKRIKKKIDDLQHELQHIQEECAHPDETLTRTPRENSGYDYQDYWYEFHCTVCDKRWREDQGPENRNRGVRVEKGNRYY